MRAVATPQPLSPYVPHATITGLGLRAYLPWVNNTAVETALGLGTSATDGDPTAHTPTRRAGWSSSVLPMALLPLGR
ncbi:MAG: hypothetical protein EXR77_10520 [Myxococcales bacterium]|nr:hypothetical protein [Myxococcales bacterium]